MSHRISFGIVVLLAGCPSDDGGGNADGSTGAASTGSTTGPTSSSSASASGSSSGESSGETSGSSGGSSEGSSGSSSSSTGEPVPCFEPTLLDALCDPMRVTFTLDSTNEYYPLVVGNHWILEGPEGTALVRADRTILPDTEMVAGVETHILEHLEYVDDVLVEVARDFFVESEDGNVCYFGEDVENYEDGVLVNNEGTWRAGVDGAAPGLIMPADPMVGDAYFQENAPANDAIDMGRVDAVGDTMMIGDTSYDDVVTVMDYNPLEGCDEGEPKLYVPGIGEAADVDVVLIEFTPG